MKKFRRWVEKHGGHPATVKRTMEKDDEPGILRIDYPGHSGSESLERISWESFFEKFDEENLAFLYQDQSDSRFPKFVARNK